MEPTELRKNPNTLKPHTTSMAVTACAQPWAGV